MLLDVFGLGHCQNLGHGRDQDKFFGKLCDYVQRTNKIKRIGPNNIDLGVARFYMHDDFPFAPIDVYSQRKVLTLIEDEDDGVLMYLCIDTRFRFAGRKLLDSTQSRYKILSIDEFNGSMINAVLKAYFTCIEMTGFDTSSMKAKAEDYLKENEFKLKV